MGFVEKHRKGAVKVVGVGLGVALLLGAESHRASASSHETEHEVGDKRVDIAFNLGRAGITNAVAVEIVDGKALVTLSSHPNQPNNCNVVFAYSQVPNGTEPLLHLDRTDAAGNTFGNDDIHNGEEAQAKMQDLCS